MKLLNAIEIAEDCGLSTIDEMKFNIELHANQLFDYNKINEELQELEDEINKIIFNNNYNLSSDINCIKQLLVN